MRRLPLKRDTRTYHYVLEALSMGSPAAVTISTSAAGQVTSWQHIIDLAPSIDGLGATFAMDQKLYVTEVTSGKIYGFSETLGEGGVVEQTFRVLGVAPTDISSININSTVYGASFPALGGKIFRNQGTFRLNAQGGGSLGIDRRDSGRDDGVHLRASAGSLVCLRLREHYRAG
jgi:hypothetical protein